LNLSSRLKRIRTIGKQGSFSENIEQNTSRAASAYSLLREHSFKDVDFMTLRRTVSAAVSEPLDPVFPETLFAMIPGLAGKVPALKAENLIFFDLETTGLSGGAGTVAFLAAFGRFENGVYDTIKIDQYLLLDYPGEAGFLRQILQMFSLKNSTDPPVIVSYNGKSFDSQIINNRYLIHGMRPPVFYHADLLYTARSLWKKTLPSCSQSEIEKSILKIERKNDIPGCRAPDIWFSFLKTNADSELSGVCGHNILDIAGLASMFSVFNSIAHDPVCYVEKYGADAETLALRIRKYRRTRRGNPSGELLETENALLEKAARSGAPLAAFLLGKDLLRNKRYREARHILGRLAERKDTALSAVADRALAIDSEWRLKDAELALFYTERALSSTYTNISLKTDLLKRRERLLRRPSQSGFMFMAN
jgi:uncharacterized protein YprB with RNaseH-like and TPR domain